jgi:hypothetical protein
MTKLAFLFLLIVHTSYAQTQASWETLSDVEWSVKYLESIEDSVMYPAFGPSVKLLKGQQITVSGYIIPVDIAQSIYVLSSNPQASCFFCGVGGPESIVELQLVDKTEIYRTDDLLHFTGTLALNWEDMEHFNYILQNAILKK